MGTEKQYRGGIPATQASRELAAKRLVDPEAFRTAVREALAAAGSVGSAAEKLGVPRRSLERWIAGDAALREGLTLPPRGYQSHKKAKVT